MKYERDIAVLDEAIAQIQKPDGFVTDHYLKPNGGPYHQKPGDDVVATCAIGGIEQAVWKLTGKAPETVGFGHRPASRRSLFGRVLRRVDEKAIELFGKQHDITGVEDLTFVVGVDDPEEETADTEVARKAVLKVFRAVKRDLKAAQA